MSLSSNCAMLAIRSFSLREERRCECERDSTTSAMRTPWVRFLVCIFMCNNRILYVNIQASLWQDSIMRHLRLGWRVLIPRNGLHNRINVGHGRLEVPRASHSAYKE